MMTDPKDLKKQNKKPLPGQFSRQEYEYQRAQLEDDRSTFLSHWRDLSDNILPRRARFQLTDTNRGERKNQKIIDSTATLAVRTLRSGMMSGITSPARQWFKLTTQDPDLANSEPVNDWLYTVSQRIANMYLKSNLYNTLPIVYGDMGVFGTGAMFVEEDFKNVIRTYPIAIGSYSIANNDRLQVDVCHRELRLTCRQLVQKFGDLKPDGSGDIDWTPFSTQIKAAWDASNYEQTFDVCHVVQPNPEYDPRKLESRYKKFISVYYEKGTQINNSSGNYMNDGYQDDKCLELKGYSFYPVLAPRWEVTGEDTYGTDCPGMTALGDIRQLQLGERRSAQAIEKMINPPMTGPTALRNSKPSILPGDMTYVDARDQASAFRAAHDVRFDLTALENKQQMIRSRIQRAFYEDLFLMLAESDRREITAREIDERHEEKLLALGPVLEQTNQDLLDPLINISFDLGMLQGMFPPPPPELQGTDLKIEYISVMAQAQKSIGSQAITGFLGIISQMAQIQPNVLDKVDTDKTLDTLGDVMSVPPGIIRDTEAAQQIRDQRQQAQAQQAKMEQMQQAAQTAQQLSNANMSGDNALTRIVGNTTNGQQQGGLAQGPAQTPSAQA